MSLNKNSTVGELRNELECKRRKATELQMNTTNAREWLSLNTLRWDLEDLDKDLYLSQFIKNNDKLAKLIGEIQKATAEAQKLIATIEDVKQSLVSARAKLKNTSPMFDEISSFLDEVELTIKVIKA